MTEFILYLGVILEDSPVAAQNAEQRHMQSSLAKLNKHNHYACSFRSVASLLCCACRRQLWGKS